MQHFEDDPSSTPWNGMKKLDIILERVAWPRLGNPVSLFPQVHVIWDVLRMVASHVPDLCSDPLRLAKELPVLFPSMAVTICLIPSKTAPMDRERHS